MTTEQSPGDAVGAGPNPPSVPNEDYTYGSPAVARQTIQRYFEYWSGKITDTSFQLSLTVLGANWAVFGTTQGVLTNTLARYSIASVVLCLAVNLIGAWWMTRLHQTRYLYAEVDHSRWRQEHAATAGKNDPWPFTSQIENTGKFLRESKTWLPIIGGLLFFAAVIFG